MSESDRNQFEVAKYYYIPKTPHSKEYFITIHHNIIELNDLNLYKNS